MQFQLNDIKFEAEGSSEEVMRKFNRFLGELIPALDTTVKK